MKYRKRPVVIETIARLEAANKALRESKSNIHRRAQQAEAEVNRLAQDIMTLEVLNHALENTLERLLRSTTTTTSALSQTPNPQTGPTPEREQK